MTSLNPRFWVDDPTELFKLHTGMIPHTGASVEANLNAITRIAFILCLLLVAFKPVLAVGTFFVMLVTIIAVYYGCQLLPIGNFPNAEHRASRPLVERFGEVQFPFTTASLTNAHRFCNDAEPLGPFDEEYVSKNQRLAGRPSLKTMIAPIVAPPSHDLNMWKASDFTTHSAINAATNFDVSGSGYTNPIFEESQPRCTRRRQIPVRRTQLLSPLSRDDQLATATMQPGVFQRSDLVEPINTLIGISQQKPFQQRLIKDTPTSHTEIMLPDDDNTVDQFPQYPKAVVDDEAVRKQNREHWIKERTQPTTGVPYDPRQTGYGPPDRGYIEPETGQPRFFYDDINSLRSPNYISRNKVDVFDWAPRYGSGFVGNDGEMPCVNYRDIANDAFHESALTFRTDLQERFMRKRNAEMYQRRAMPVITNRV